LSDPALDAFAAHFADPAALPGDAATREAAWQSFLERGFPSPRDEDWRFASLDTIRETAWTAGSGAAQPQSGHRAAGVSFQPLSERLAAGPVPGLSALTDEKAHGLVALNRALVRDGVVLSIEPGASLEEPIDFAHGWGDDVTARAVQSRNLIRVGAGSRAVVIERLGRHAGGPVFANLVTEIELEASARLDYITLQDAAANDQIFSHVRVRQAEGSHFASHSIALGGEMHRAEVRAELAGEGSHCELNGLYLGRDRQKLDHYTTIDHATPHTTSDELYKGILADRAHGVFHGRIRVRPHAQKIQALQSNGNLVLSNRARVNTKPQLEIYADDVRCTHGATIGRLDPDQLFFLRARGVPEAQAVALLTYGFASEVLARLPIPELADGTRREILGWLGQATS